MNLKSLSFVRAPSMKLKSSTRSWRSVLRALDRHFSPIAQVKLLLRKWVSVISQMKLSRFVVLHRASAGSFLYSGMSGAVVKVTNEIMDLLEGGQLQFLPERDAQVLKQQYVIVDQEVDELAILERRYTAGKSDREHLGLTIISSLGCNFACPYCYEAKELSLLNPDVEEAILRSVSYRAHGLKTLQIHWLGGEPLMAKRQLLSLSGRLKEIAHEAGILYFANVTTNGFLLNLDTARSLKKAGITHAQVCLDGPPETHDVKRPHVSGNGTFSQIINNLERVVDVLDVTIRMNVDAENYDRASELFELLVEHGLNEKVMIYAGQLVKVDDGAPIPTPSATYPSTCFSGPEFARVEAEFIRQAAAYGFNRPALPGPIATPCTAVRDDEFVVGSAGELYKCWENVGNPTRVVGTIFDLRSIDARDWAWYSPFNDEECVACVALPSCMGGCLHHLKDKNLRDSRCSTFRENHIEQIDAFISQTYDPIQHSRRSDPLSPSGLVGDRVRKHLPIVFVKNRS